MIKVTDQELVVYYARKLREVETEIERLNEALTTCRELREYDAKLLDQKEKIIAELREDLKRAI